MSQHQWRGKLAVALSSTVTQRGLQTSSRWHGTSRTGQDRSTALCQESFYWPGMSTDVIKCFSRCSRCTCAKAHSLPHCAPLENIITSQPMEMVALDYLTLEDGHGGVAKVLVITDHFSKYVSHTYYPPDCQDDSPCFLWDFHSPHKGHSDQGRNCESKIIKELCAVAGMKNSVRPHTTQWETGVLNDSTWP